MTEAKLAKRREAIAWWLKFIAFIGFSAALIWGGYAIVAARNADLDRQEEVLRSKHEIRLLIEEANKVKPGSAGYGIAQLTKVLGAALLAAEVK